MTLPGERVFAGPVATRGKGFSAVAETIEFASADRATPPCPHFGTCGGCALQHWKDEPLGAWKSGRIAAALHRAGFAWHPTQPIRTPASARRRVDLALRRLPTGLALGLHARGGTDIVAIPDCRVLHPCVMRILAPLRDTLDRLAAIRREGSVLINLLDTGPDLLLRHDGPLSAPDRQRLGAFAEAWRIPRIAAKRASAPWETACQFGPATLAFAGVSVAPPPGAFLQASREGEAAIVAAVLAGLPDKMNAKSAVVELFAGCGTLTFPLAARARVIAFEGDAEAARSLAAASGQSRVKTVRRDLARQPLAKAELPGHAAIVLDPPFAGAAEQMPAIAAARVSRVIYVSCNPAALARDAAILAAAGYRLHAASPIDQFRWSPHIEAVATFAL